MDCLQASYPGTTAVWLVDRHPDQSGTPVSTGTPTNRAYEFDVHPKLLVADDSLNVTRSLSLTGTAAVTRPG
jgi:hypothetical protein